MQLRSFLYCLIFVTAFGIAATAQSGPPPDDAAANSLQQPQRRPNLLRALGLTTEQLQQLKQINQERRPQVDAALRRLGGANRALDEAIYADVVNEAEVGARLKEVQEAQGEVARIRFMNELAVRRILTPEQLVRFRDLRQQFTEAREKFRNERRGRPFRRGGQQPKPIQE